MSEEQPEYFRLPDGTYSVDTGMGRTIFADPALLTPAQLATLADTLAGERQRCADEPATPLGFWPTAVAALLGHVEETAEELTYARLLAVQTEKAMITLTRRVKEQQAELSEQEVAKLALVKEGGQLVDALHIARLALEWSYDVTEYPADGTSQQAKALDGIKRVLAALAERVALAAEGSHCHCAPMEPAGCSFCNGEAGGIVGIILSEVHD